jgi:hypothetical protein
VGELQVSELIETMQSDNEGGGRDLACVNEHVRGRRASGSQQMGERT